MGVTRPETHYFTPSIRAPTTTTTITTRQRMEDDIALLDVSDYEDNTNGSNSCGSDGSAHLDGINPSMPIASCCITASMSGPSGIAVAGNANPPSTDNHNLNAFSQGSAQLGEVSPVANGINEQTANGSSAHPQGIRTVAHQPGDASSSGGGVGATAGTKTSDHIEDICARSAFLKTQLHQFEVQCLDYK